jgi:hypothetical protein
MPLFCVCLVPVCVGMITGMRGRGEFLRERSVFCSLRSCRTGQCAFVLVVVPSHVSHFWSESFPNL